MQEAELPVTHEFEDRQEPERGPGALGPVDGHQNASDVPRSTPDDRDGAGRVPGDGQRCTPDEEPPGASETARSEHDHVRPCLFRHMDDLHLGIAKGDDGPPPPATVA